MQQALKRTKKIKAGALVITVVISILIFLFCNAVVSIGLYNRQVQQQYFIRQRQAANLQSGINLLLSDTLELYKETEVNFFDGDSVALRKYPWGLFGVATVSVSKEKFSMTKCFMYGSPLPGFMRGCLYLADHQRPVSIGGNNNLHGEMYIPAGEMRSVYVGGNYSIQGQLPVHASDSSLPKIAMAAKNYLFGLSEKDSQLSAKVPDSSGRSFLEPAEIIHVSAAMRLEHNKFSGHVLLQSDSLIEIGKDVQLDNVVLVAPVIRFEAGFSGAVQAFASRELTVGVGCNFDYPS
ncbi:MAG TPA: hypothetical protein VEB42_13295, partial [Chitinophagaceae bacterium]|nr:hypothetical protein [Chitinophagaceae bacterium]